MLVFLGLSLLASPFLVTLHSILPAWALYADSYTVSPGGRDSLGIGLVSGSTVRVMVAVDGEDSDINFSIEDCDGKAIISGEIGSDEHFFCFQPSRTDFHILVFRNNGSTVQTVDWIVGVYYYDTLFWLSGFLLLIFGAVLTVLRGKRENQTLRPVPWLHGA